MRIDKFLWCVRYFKTRNIATDACKKGKVKIDGISVKPSREVYVGNQISIKKNQIEFLVEVIAFPENRVGAKLTGLYINDITPNENLEKLELLKLSQDYYRKKGTGRPTKKDRRDLDDFTT
ncbi:MAG TPA: RNA-binding S4 domain-containing protein [Flavobacteriaceae bacterium]|jgi:ribosome-associated heat shock protein Hsp15|nr:RNA-binding S4 domain-containing protein [Flavobacteriaceae bacterium]